MRVGVVGASIGGLTVAAGMAADGHKVVVYERRDDPGAVGAGLTLFCNAFGALDTIGLGDRIRAISSDAISHMQGGNGCRPGTGSSRCRRQRCRRFGACIEPICTVRSSKRSPLTPFD